MNYSVLVIDLTRNQWIEMSNEFNGYSEWFDGNLFVPDKSTLWIRQSDNYFIGHSLIVFILLIFIRSSIEMIGNSRKTIFN